MNTILLALLPITCALVSYSIQKIIYIAEKKHLFDEPTETRKIHLVKTPNLGGVAIFATMFFVSSLLLPSLHMPDIRYVGAGAILLFFLGLMDDLVGVDPVKKLMAQVIAALLVIIPGDIRLTGGHGFLGIGEFSYVVSVLLTVIFVVLVINALNLIDGINCLAGGIALLNCVVFGALFASMHQDGYFFLCVCLSGCLLGFLSYNRTPARIFMGDTGSLFLGFLLAIFAIKFVELNAGASPGVASGISGVSGVSGAAGVTVMLSLLIVPLYDTLRVFIIRISKGRSPLLADKNHLHHLLLRLRLTHMQATGLLLAINCAAVLLAFSSVGLPSAVQLMIVVSVMLLMNRILVKLKARKVSVPAATAPRPQSIVVTKAPVEKEEAEPVLS